MKTWNIIRKKISTRGGGIEVDLTNMGWPGVRMTAYQNYLGGGILGLVRSDCTIRDWMDSEELSKIAEELRQYFRGLTNPEGWELTTRTKPSPGPHTD